MDAKLTFRGQSAAPETAHVACRNLVISMRFQNFADPKGCNRFIARYLDGGFLFAAGFFYLCKAGR
jgi:hypothetical protein